MSIPHREYLFEKSVEISLMLADKIIQKDTIPKKIVHPDLGELLNLLPNDRLSYYIRLIKF